MTNRKIAFVDEEFYNLVKEIKRERIKSGTDLESQSDRRITKAIARQIRFNMNDYVTLVKSPFEKDTKVGGRKIKFRK